MYVAPCSAYMLLYIASYIIISFSYVYNLTQVAKLAICILLKAGRSGLSSVNGGTLTQSSCELDDLE